MDLLPTKLIKIIVSYCKFSTQVKFTQINHFYCNNFPITDLLNIPKHLKDKLSNQIIQAYPKCQYLCAAYNIQINQSGIMNLTQLRELDCKGNSKINSVNHLTEFKILDVCFDCGIDQKGIEYCLKLKKLNCDNNTKINSVNHLTNLEILSAAGHCSIDQKEIQNCLKLKRLGCYRNSKINSVNHLTNLEILNSNMDRRNMDYGIDQKGIKNCLKLKELRCNWNAQINSVNHLTNLKILYAGGNCGIDEKGIQNWTHHTHYIVITTQFTYYI